MSFFGTAGERASAVVPFRVNQEFNMDLVSIIAVSFGVAYIALVIHTIITSRSAS